MDKWKSTVAANNCHTRDLTVVIQPCVIKHVNECQ